MTPSHPLFCHAFLFRTRGAVRASIQGVVQDPGNAPGCESTQAHHASRTWAAKRRSCCSRSILGLWSVPGWWWLRSGSEPAARSYDCDLLIGSWAPENWGSEWWSPGFPEGLYRERGRRGSSQPREHGTAFDCPSRAHRKPSSPFHHSLLCCRFLGRSVDK